MAASALTHATRRGLLARRSPVLKMEKDDRLVAMIRSGHEGAFEVLVKRYESRLLGFCTSMLKSRQDAEDVLQDVFVNAHAAMLADERRINVRPWLYRIARNRCLNLLRKPVPEGTDSMDIHPHLNGTTTAERVQNREELRQVLNDVGTLPETQRTALLLREIDQLCYEEIAVAMETTVPAVKSLLVRARITLAESSEARTLSCDEVRVTLAEAAEGLRKASGPVRIHVRNCEPCQGFRDQLRTDHKALAAVFPLGPLALLKFGFLGKLFGGGSAAGGGATATAGGTVSAIGGAAAGSGATAGGLGAIGGAIGTKALAGMATAALITAGAVEVAHERAPSQPATSQVERIAPPPAAGGGERGEGGGDEWRHSVKQAVGTGVTAAAVTENADAAEPPPAEEPPVDEETVDEPAAEIVAEQELTEEFEGDGEGEAHGAPEPIGLEPIDPDPRVLPPVDEGSGEGEPAPEPEGEPAPVLDPAEQPDPAEQDEDQVDDPDLEDPGLS